MNDTSKTQPTTADALVPIFSTPQANECVDLYRGGIRLIQGDKHANGEGHLYFSWLPAPSVRFEWKVSEVKWNQVDVGDAKIELIDEQRLTSPVDVKIRRRKVDTRGATSVSGSISRVSLGTPSSLHKVVFHLPNLRQFFGQPIQRGTTCFTGRATMRTDCWYVTIDEVAEKELWAQLKDEGGYGITHVGTIQRKDQNDFSTDEVDRILDTLHWYTSFCCGRWTGPVLPIGYNRHGEAVWEQWGSKRATPFLGVRCWNCDTAECFSQLFNGFMTQWQNESWAETIRNSVYWYINANTPGASIENAIILSFVAFESLGWTLLVEDSATLSSDGYGKMQFSDKLRLLLSNCNIPLTIPTDLIELEAAARAKNWPDGPECVAVIRNAHVHTDSKKRKLLSEIGIGAVYDAHALTMTYLELVLLRLFEYDGQYLSRTVRGGTYKADAIQTVPWAS